MAMQYRVDPHSQKPIYKIKPYFQSSRISVRLEVSDKETSKRHVNLFLEDIDTSKSEDENI